jgi:hypothetical protein
MQSELIKSKVRRPFWNMVLDLSQRPKILKITLNIKEKWTTL